jgi:type IV pilus assembly protein PilA
MVTRLQKRLASEESGFTLIELLVVIIILGILLAIAVPAYLGFQDRANKSAAQANVRSTLPSIQAYFADRGSYANIGVTNLITYDSALSSSNVVVQEGTSTAVFDVCATSGNWYASLVNAAGAGTPTVSSTSPGTWCP